MDKKRGRPKAPAKDKVISERIKIARTLVIPKLTQQNLADKLGVSLDTVRNWEHGRALPDNEQRYEELAAICHVKKEWLMNKEIPDIINMSLNILKNCNPNECECITFPSIKEESRSYALIYSLIMCGYSLDAIKNKQQYCEYMEATINNAIEFYMNNIN